MAVMSTYQPSRAVTSRTSVPAGFFLAVAKYSVDAAVGAPTTFTSLGVPLTCLGLMLRLRYLMNGWASSSAGVAGAGGWGFAQHHRRNHMAPALTGDASFSS